MIDHLRGREDALCEPLGWTGPGRPNGLRLFVCTAEFSARLSSVITSRVRRRIAASPDSCKTLIDRRA